jgi:beta-galactosidase
MRNFTNLFFAALFSGVFLSNSHLNAQNVRERISMDEDWRFALGHATDVTKDFYAGTAYFTYFAKAGNGDGPASPTFDDRAWRKLNVPHDWCVELPFDPKGGHSHGYKAIGYQFPENSVGWYRKSFYIPETDLGKKITIDFDGIHRNSIVWVNGFYLGTELSGNASFSYDITDYLNYGGENIIAVRVDASIEEGWYYEGAGIYRHVWMTKTNPLHVARYGTFVTSKLKGNMAILTTRTTVINQSDAKQLFDINEIILDSTGKTLTSGGLKRLSLLPGEEMEFFNSDTIKNPQLWSISNPYLHQLKTEIKTDNKLIDAYSTTFGIRTVRFDADSGFFLNDQPLKIIGTNNHQDHAGVGTALPDELQEYRINILKKMGSNGIRCSHNPPTPEFLDACDRLGMLVVDENRLMGTNQEHFNWLTQMMKRDRNHPCLVLWSLGNEEWKIEGNIKGARIAKTMQDFAQHLDSSRAFTIAVSGGWDDGIGQVMQVMGYNYMVQGDIDVHHAKFPWQAGIGTEETNYRGTRGIYQTEMNKGHMAATKRDPENVATQDGWNFYASRPFLSGLFYWTGFDYRGESNPCEWPAVTSPCGILDLCGFPKDIYYYLQSWWGNEPVLHIFPHWNWPGDEGKDKLVAVYSNCDQVELFVNGKSQGKKEMKKNGLLEWTVKYQPGSVSAKGYKNNKVVLNEKIETTTETTGLKLQASQPTLKATGEDIAVINISVIDKKGRIVPTANIPLSFGIEGNGKIIGVGNGDPASHEKEQFVQEIKTAGIKDLKELPVKNLSNRPEIAPETNDLQWRKAFIKLSDNWQDYLDTLLVVRGTFELPGFDTKTLIYFYGKSILENQSVYINGHLVTKNIKRDAANQSYQIDPSWLKEGKNVYAATGQRFKLKYKYDEPNTDPGLIQLIYPEPEWKRNTFNGFAQVIVQAGKETGSIKLKVTSDGLVPAELIIPVK